MAIFICLFVYLLIVKFLYSPVVAYFLLCFVDLHCELICGWAIPVKILRGLDGLPMKIHSVLQNTKNHNLNYFLRLIFCQTTL